MVVFDLVVGILSIALAVLAIWLSVRLYLMSEAANEKMREAERSIQKNVEQLDRLFSLLYSDTWSLVRDSYKNMQESLWDRVRLNARAADGESPESLAPGRPIGQSEASSIASENEVTRGLLEFIAEAFERLNSSGNPVRLIEIARLAEQAGYSTMETLNCLYELTFVERKLFLSGDQFTPNAIIAETPERARELGIALQERVISRIEVVRPSSEEPA